MTRRRANREGFIFKENSTGLWCAEISLSNGKRRKKRAKRQQAVKEWLLEQRTLLSRGVFVTDDKILFGEYLDRFLTDIATPTLKPKTVDSHRWLSESHTSRIWVTFD